MGGGTSQPQSFYETVIDAAGLSIISEKNMSRRSSARLRAKAKVSKNKAKLGVLEVVDESEDKQK